MISIQHSACYDDVCRYEDILVEKLMVQKSKEVAFYAIRIAKFRGNKLITFAAHRRNVYRCVHTMQPLAQPVVLCKRGVSWSPSLCAVANVSYAVAMSSWHSVINGDVFSLQITRTHFQTTTGPRVSHSEPRRGISAASRLSGMNVRPYEQYWSIRADTRLLIEGETRR